METNITRIQRDIEKIGEFTLTPGEGTTRFTYTKEYDGARKYIINEMKAAGLAVYEDSVGNIFGRRDGLQDGPVVMLGSHFDSVKNGGGFDGVAGVVAGLEIARVLQEKNIRTQYPVEFAALIEEEGGRFGGGLFASRLMVGAVKEEELHTFKDRDGISMAEAMKPYGFAPENFTQAIRRKEDVKAFFELHIEQGPILENDNRDIGVVDYIVGLTQFEITICGSADHAGTTPMDMRKDALVGAAQAVAALPNLAIAAGNGTVATVGWFAVSPGAANAVPGKVTFTVDIRSRSEQCIIEVKKQFAETIANVCGGMLTYQITDKIFVNPVKMSENFVKVFQKNCEKLNFTYKNMVSGAGHDAMVLAAITDVGLVFVPSKGGKSHSPAEWTDYDKLQKGIELLYHTIKDFA